MRVDPDIRCADLGPALERLWELSGAKIDSIVRTYPEGAGSPVFTVRGRYASRGWTEWTQGFHYGSAILQFEATGDERFLAVGREGTVARMAPHVSHFGVHDHGFNNVSTYGNLWRLMNERKLPEVAWERAFYELALKVSGAVQARRWTRLRDDHGFIHSFNGPHSLFVDTIRSLRSLALAHLLGHVLMDEGDAAVSLLERLKQHALATATYSVYYGEGRDIADVRGRVAHESIFDVVDGSYRCPGTQQGYSPFTTWTRGLAWAMCGFAEQLEFLRAIGDEEVTPALVRAAEATCDQYVEVATAADGVPYWDTGAPGLQALGDWRSRPAQPDNEHEPVDSSAAAIAAQALLRLGRYLGSERYRQAGLTVAATLLEKPYLSCDPDHQGLLLHSVYHRPNGWDHAPRPDGVPGGESSMWGDYHIRELGLYLQRMLAGEPELTFFAGAGDSGAPLAADEVEQSCARS